MRSLRSRRGTTAIEYALIATLIGVTRVAVFTQLGGMVEVLYRLTDAVSVAI